MASESTPRKRITTKATALVLAFLTALTSLGALTINPTDALPGRLSPVVDLSVPTNLDISDTDWRTEDWWSPNQKPYFQNRTCSFGFIGAIFVDPDGSESLMKVEMTLHYEGDQSRTLWMDRVVNSDGVFFSQDLRDSDVVLLPQYIERFSMRAVDVLGAKSDSVTFNYVHGRRSSCPDSTNR